MKAIRIGVRRQQERRGEERASLSLGVREEEEKEPLQRWAPLHRDPMIQYKGWEWRSNLRTDTVKELLQAAHSDNSITVWHYQGFCNAQHCKRLIYHTSVQIKRKTVLQISHAHHEDFKVEYSVQRVLYLKRQKNNQRFCCLKYLSVSHISVFILMFMHEVVTLVSKIGRIVYLEYELHNLILIT